MSWMVSWNLVASMTCSGNIDQTLSNHASTICFDTVHYKKWPIQLHNHIITVQEDMLLKIILQPQITQLHDNNITIIWLRKIVDKKYISIPNSAIRLCSKDSGDTTVLPLAITVVLKKWESLDFRWSTTMFQWAKLDSTNKDALITEIPETPSVLLDIGGYAV